MRAGLAGVWVVWAVLGAWWPAQGISADGFSADGEEWKPTVLLVSLDGFRWDYLERTATPHLDRFIAEGTRAESLTPVFPTLTFPNHYTIVTGLYSENHGIVGNTMYDPEMDAWFRPSDRDAVGNGAWWGGEPIWVTAERQGQIAATYFWPGSEAAIGGIRPTHWKVYDGSVPGEDRVAEVLAWLALPVEERPTLVTLYFNDCDQEGHDYGPDSVAVTAAIARVDEYVGALLAGLDALGAAAHVNVMIVSDHGMTEVGRGQIIELRDYVDLSRVRVVGHGAYVTLTPAPGDEEAVYDALKEADPRFRVYWKEALPERLRYRAHRRIPALVGLVEPGWVVEPTAAYARSRGMHGYDPKHEEMQGVFFARGPAFRVGLTAPALESIHLYALMAHLLGLTAAPNDGSLEAVRGLLRE